jgi:hypothetical protein
MSYGIRVTGNDSGGDFLELDSSLNLINYVVTHYGTAATVNVSNVSGLDQLVFIRNTPGDPSRICFSQSGSTITFIEGRLSKKVPKFTRPATPSRGSKILYKII